MPETVTVGNPGNAADTTKFGAVPYTCKIGKYEVTNAEYCEFLNAAAAIPCPLESRPGTMYFWSAEL